MSVLATLSTALNDEYKFLLESEKLLAVASQRGQAERLISDVLDQAMCLGNNLWHLRGL